LFSDFTKLLFKFDRDDFFKTIWEMKDDGCDFDVSVANKWLKKFKPLMTKFRDNSDIINEFKNNTCPHNICSFLGFYDAKKTLLFLSEKVAINLNLLVQGFAKRIVALALPNENQEQKEEDDDEFVDLSEFSGAIDDKDEKSLASTPTNHTHWLEQRLTYLESSRQQAEIFSENPLMKNCCKLGPSALFAEYKSLDFFKYILNRCRLRNEYFANLYLKSIATFQTNISIVKYLLDKPLFKLEPHITPFSLKVYDFIFVKFSDDWCLPPLLTRPENSKLLSFLITRAGEPNEIKIFSKFFNRQYPPGKYDPTTQYDEILFQQFLENSSVVEKLFSNFEDDVKDSLQQVKNYLSFIKFRLSKDCNFPTPIVNIVLSC
jgi:hypothetical protein